MRQSTLMTEFNDISQRLEYLVAHSSQMVFVTGEDLAIQRGFVEAFLGQQSRNANVAFISAKKNRKRDYYRQQLAEQLYLDSSASKMPLVQAFSTRKDKQKPVIIAVTHAEDMAKDVLKELWDLVLQNRFARNDEQINILVFGEQAWAEDVKSWLPTNNNDKPVLLTTQTLEYEEEHEIEGDLDQLIENRRKQFQERMKARSLNYHDDTGVLRAWWFRLMTACFFVATFSIILIWQYFDVTSTAAKEFTQFLFQSDVSEVAEEPVVDTQPLEMQPVPIPDTLAVAEPTQPAINNLNNERVSDSFAAALSSLSATRANEGQAPEQQEGFSGRPSAEYAMDEYVVDISPETLKQLRQDSVVNSTNNDSETDSTETVARPINGISPVTNEAANQPVDVVQNPEPEISDTSAAEFFAQESNALMQQGRDEMNDASISVPESPELNAAISSALEEMEAMQSLTVTRSSNVAGATVQEQIQNVADVVLGTLAPEPAQPETINQDSAVNDATVVAQDTEISQESDTPIETNTDISASSEPVVTEPDVFEYSEEALLNGGDVNDYPVQDIVTEEQALASAGAATANESETSGPAEADTVLSDNLVALRPNPYQFNEEALNSRLDSDYVLQITGISTQSLLTDYLRDNDLNDRVWVYKTERYGGDWFVVLFNQSYASLDDARAATDDLKSVLPNAQPFAKAVATVKQEIALLN